MNGEMPVLTGPSAVSRKQKYQRHLPAALLCLILVAIYLWPDQDEAVIVSLVVGLALLLLGLVNLVLILFRPRRSSWRALNLGMVMATCLGLMAHADFTKQRARDAVRRDVEVVRKQVEAYHARTGTWPERLAEAGADPEVVSKHKLGFGAGSDGAELYYREKQERGSMSVTGYIYNFKRGNWVQWTRD